MRSAVPRGALLKGEAERSAVSEPCAVCSSRHATRGLEVRVYTGRLVSQVASGRRSAAPHVPTPPAAHARGHREVRTIVMFSMWWRAVLSCVVVSAWVSTKPKLLARGPLFLTCRPSPAAI